MESVPVVVSEKVFDIKITDDMDEEAAEALNETKKALVLKHFTTSNKGKEILTHIYLQEVGIFFSQFRKVLLQSETDINVITGDLDPEEEFTYPSEQCAHYASMIWFEYAGVPKGCYAFGSYTDGVYVIYWSKTPILATQKEE